MREKTSWAAFTAATLGLCYAIACGNPTDLAPRAPPRTATYSIDDSGVYVQVSCTDTDARDEPDNAHDANGWPVEVTCHWDCAIWPYGPQPADWAPDQLHRVDYAFVRVDDGSTVAEQEIAEHCE